MLEYSKKLKEKKLKILEKWIVITIVIWTLNFIKFGLLTSIFSLFTMVFCYLIDLVILSDYVNSVERSYRNNQLDNYERIETSTVIKDDGKIKIDICSISKLK